MAWSALGHAIFDGAKGCTKFEAEIASDFVDKYLDFYTKKIYSNINIRTKI